MRRALLAGAILATTTTLALATASPASAGQITVRDPRGDSGVDFGGGTTSGDVTSLTVQHTSRRVIVTVRVVAEPDWYTARLDTRSARSGAEFEIDFGLDYYAQPVRPYISIYSNVTHRKVSCAGKQSAALRSSSGRVIGHRISVPRSCLGRPARVRAGLRTNEEGGYLDFAPGSTRWGWSPWVRRG